MRQHLIFDADDTLWANNIFFEDAFDEFCDYLRHSALSPDEIRAILDEIEIVNNKVHGYGTLNFARNLSQCYLRLAERAVDDHDFERVKAIAHRIFSREMEIMPGVEETLPVLAERHELTLFTKGDSQEQNAKIDRSGLRPLFSHCAVVKEKNRDAYLELAQSRKFDLTKTWMIGNSPKSDINPSLAAGLGAVFVPHARTWTLEREDLSSGERLIVVQSFRDLLDVF